MKPTRDVWGVGIVELVVTLALAAVLFSLVGATGVRTLRRFHRVAERTEVVRTLMLSRHVLGVELRAGTAEDRAVSGPDAIGVRAFRGAAAFCPERDETSVARVRFRGDRRPDPDKDSVLVLDRSGRWSAVGLTAAGATTTACAGAPSFDVERWTLSEPVAGAVLGRLYESGTYSLDTEALRYRRGLGGRQPITPLRLDPSRSSVHVTADGLTIVVSTGIGPVQPVPVSRFLRIRERS